MEINDMQDLIDKMEEDKTKRMLDDAYWRLVEIMNRYGIWEAMAMDIVRRSQESEDLESDDMS